MVFPTSQIWALLFVYWIKNVLKALMTVNLVDDIHNKAYLFCSATLVLWGGELGEFDNNDLFEDV